MDRKRKKLENSLYNLIYSHMVLTLSYLCALPIKVDLILPLKILMVYAITIIVKLLLTYPIILYILMITILTGLIIVNYFINDFIVIFLRRMFSLFENIYYHIKEMEAVESENILIFWGIIIAILSIFTWYVIFKSKNPFILLPVYIAGIMYYWYIYYDEAYIMMGLFLFLFLILLGLRNYSKIKEYGNKKISDKFNYTYGAKIRIILTYSLVIVVLAISLPKSNRYIHWQWLKETANEVFPFLEDFRSTSSVKKAGVETSTSITRIIGYPDKPTKLGGPIILNDEAVMNVYGKGPIYLRGNIRHTYTGTHWLTEKNKEVNYELREDFSGLTKEERNKYYRETSYLIINRTLTNTIFSPYKPSMVNFESMYKLVKNQDDILYFSGNIDVGDRYTVTVLEPFEYDELIALGINNKRHDLENISIYLQLPDSITDSTKELVKEITEKVNTDYEKAKAIEKYLRENYRYTLEVNAVPEGYDFVDYFLFHGQEGYCTYFATAMAIMLRLEGIPTRYVEGYLAHEAREEGIYIVRNNNAHSWVEAYIEPIGWMTFEPTPAYPLPSELDVAELEEASESQRDIKADADKGNALNDILMPTPEIENDSFPAVQSLNKRVEGKYLVITGLILILLGMSMKFIIRFIKNIYKDIKISRMPNKEKLIYLYNEIIKLIELRGIIRKKGETHFEFADRIIYNFSSIDSKGIKDITEIFVKNKYSNYPTSDEDVKIVEEYKKTMEKRIRRLLGLRTYIYRKYFK